ncbi:MAG TPA: transglycosylase SLT domain-containing protein [Pyrinomonadaceae bacterium]|nr:transglycosylase SLT domain-containing protein [Pyrinomonadaceae bacterium]
MRFLFAASLLAILALTETAGQDLAGSHEKIRQLIDDRRHTEAIDELHRLAAADHRIFTGGNYDYLLARIAQKDGRLGQAMSAYAGVAARESSFRPYAHERMAALARSTGNLMFERIYLDEILLFAPQSVPAAGAAHRLPRSSFDRGNYREAIRLLSGAPVVTEPLGTTDKTGSREDKKVLAEGLLRDGQVPRAREMFAALLDTDPNQAQPDDVSLAAAKALDLMDGSSDTEAATLTESEHWRRASIYQFSREFARARLHFAALVDRYPESQKAPDALFQIGRGHAQIGEFGEALKSFERILELHPQSLVAKETLLNTGSAYARLGRTREAISRYQAFIDRYPTDEKLDRAFLNSVDIYRDQDSDTEALAWCEKTRSAFEGKLPAALATFASARIHISREDWPNALAALDRLLLKPNLGGAPVPGGTSRPEVDFLRAFALEQQRRYGEAIDEYLAIRDGREEYYGWRASERLMALGDDPSAGSLVADKAARLAAALGSADTQDSRAAAQALLRITKDPVVRERALSKLRTQNDALSSPQPSSKTATKPDPVTDQFLALGLYEEAARSIRLRAGALTYETAIVQTRGNRADLALAFIEPIWRRVPADYPIEMIAPTHAELLYPTPFADELLAVAPEYRVDPRLVLAIMRQESRFQPDAKSYASARGLMQFIPETSRLVAGELGREAPLDDDLYHPTTAIRFGSHYLASLFRAFPGQPEAVTASYNGGDDNMLRWLRRSRSTVPDRYVPEIAYAQTKDYVYRIMANYRMYQHLYDENLRPRS